MKNLQDCTAHTGEHGGSFHPDRWLHPCMFNFLSLLDALHGTSNEETTEENKTLSRFMYSAKIHSFQYTYIPFCLQLVSAMVFPFSELWFKKQQVGLSLLSNVSFHGGSLCHLWPAGGWGGMCECWRSILRPFLLPCQVPFCFRASSDILVREYWHSHIVPLSTSTAIPKCPPCTMISPSQKTALAADNRQDLDFCDTEIPDSNRYSLPRFTC